MHCTVDQNDSDKLLWCRKLEQEQRAKEQAYKVQVAKAKAMATALSTIGKFEVFKRVGEGKRIYGR